MRLTKTMLAFVYGALRERMPFCRWNLPPPEEVTFGILPKKADFFGDYMRGKCGAGHRIRLSQELHGRMSAVLSTMAHEMCHMKLECAGRRERNDHGPQFRKLASRVCRHNRDFDIEFF